MDKYSPKGNLTQKAAEQFGKFFKREIKGAGKVPNPASALPMKDCKTGIDKQFGPGDKVC